MIAEFLFSLFSVFLIACALGVVLVRTPFYSVLFLILAFFNAGGLFLLKGAEFLAMALVIVYIGAVAVLFLFVVMMVNQGKHSLSPPLKEQSRGIMLLAGFFALEMILICYQLTHQQAIAPANLPISATLTNTEAIGEVLYTHYFYPFQIAGFILLVAMIGAIVLSFNPSLRPLNRKQQINKQLQRTKSETLVIEKVKSGQGLV